jgi:hypothetical protein
MLFWILEFSETSKVELPSKGCVDADKGTLALVTLKNVGLNFGFWNFLSMVRLLSKGALVPKGVLWPLWRWKVLDWICDFEFCVQDTGLIKVPKKLVSTSKSTYVSMSNESILQINLILASPNLVLTFYTSKVSNKNHNFIIIKEV